MTVREHTTTVLHSSHIFARPLSLGVRPTLPSVLPVTIPITFPPPPLSAAIRSAAAAIALSCNTIRGELEVN